MPQEESKTKLSLTLARPALKLQADDRLVELARAGHGEAFETIVERYRRPLTSHCRRMVGADLAQDVVQQTFTSAHDQLRNDGRELHLRAWLYRVATNLALNTLRQKDSGHEPLNEQSGFAEQPDATFERREELKALVKSLRRLPERERHALLLKEAEGKSFADIALILGGTTQGVKQLAYRARRRLRDTCGALIPVPLLLWLLRGGKGLGASKGAALAGARGFGWLKFAAAVLVIGTGIFGANAMRNPSAPKQALADQSRPGQAPTADPAQTVPAPVATPRKNVAVAPPPSSAPVIPYTQPAPAAVPGPHRDSPDNRHQTSHDDGAQPTDKPKAGSGSTGTNPGDTTAPDTTLSGPGGPTSDNTPTFDFSSSESGSSFRCRLDSAAWSACSSPDTLATLSDGSYSFQVRATDAAGNTDPTPAAAAFTVSTGGLGPTWQASAPLSAAGQSGAGPDVAFDDDGNAFAVWRLDTGADLRVQTAYRPSGGSFGSAQTLSGPGDFATMPEIAVNGSGDAVAIWERVSGGNLHAIEASYRPAGGTFGAAQTISDPADVGADPDVAIDEQGNVLAIWVQYDGSNFRAQVADRPAGGSFGPAETLSDPGNNARYASVTVDDQGDALAAWQRFDGSNERVQTAYRPAGGAFASTQTLSDPGQDAFKPEAAMNADGDAVVIWARGSQGDRLAQAAHRTAGGSFGAVETISDPGEDVYNWHVAIDGQGDSVAIWERLVGSSESVQSAERPAGGSFGSAETISRADLAAVEPQMAINDQGDVVVVWQGVSPVTGSTVQSAFRPADGDFEEPQFISNAANSKMTPKVAIDDQGNVIAAWKGYDGVTQRVEVALANW